MLLQVLQVWLQLHTITIINKALKKTVDVNLFSNVSGFVGVYLAGYILELR